MEIKGNEIYQRIVDMIKERNIVKKDFYSKTGITRQNLVRWKLGSLPSIDVLYAIKEELNVSLEWLLIGNTSQDSNNPSAPYQIVNRIDDCIERETKHKKYEPSSVFYSCISDIVNEYEIPDWFCGRQTIDISKVSKIADKFGESVQYFLTGSHISKSEYTKKYSGTNDSEDADFKKNVASLNSDNKQIIQKMARMLREEQDKK